ncbi:MAG: site-specific integrase [Anaerolineae bacterium]|nr:site-specific integrase [Anaerolineae bacterium]
MREMIDSFLTWLVEKKNSSENTIMAYRNDLGQFWTFLTANSAAQSWAGVTEGDILAYLREIESREYAPATVARKMAAVRSFFHYLVLTEVLADDPTLQVGASTPVRPSPSQLSQQVAQQLLDSVTLQTPLALRDRALMGLVAGVGLKTSQVVTLNRQDLELGPAGGTVRLRGRRGREQVVALPESVAADLALYLDEGWPRLVGKFREAELPEMPLFLNARGGRLSRQGLWLVLKERGEEAGLGRGVSPRALRGAWTSE